MKSKLMLELIALTSIAMMLLAIPAAVTAAGPRTGTMLIHIYYNPDMENADLPSTLDINDWPLTSDWIAKWSKAGSGVTLQEYKENGLMEFDMNNQEWPTGWPGMYDPLDPRMAAATHFRKAIAYLTDKAKIMSDILKGFGIADQTPLTPSLASFWQHPNITAGNDYPYGRASALAELAAGGFYLEGGLWKWTGGEVLPKLKIYSRLDDPNRRTAADYLVAELRAIGFGDAQIDYKITERTVCYQYVMVLYEYHIYTGGWSLSADPDYLYDLYSSEYYFGWGAPTVGWAPNYPGFCYEVFDSAASQLKYAANVSVAQSASWNATKIFHDMEPIVPLWSAAAVKAYKAGLTGVVNEDGYGVDNAYSFMRIGNTGGDIIDYGFKSEPEALHVISSQWLWDWNVIGMVYDSLIGRNPYNLAEWVGWLATDWSVGTWDMGGGKKGTEITFTIRTGVKWQDGTDFTADDVVFSWQFTKACGSGVAWNYALVRDMNSSWVSGVNQVTIRYNKLSMFFLASAGGLPMIPKSIWEGQFPDWNTTSFNPSTVRAWHPWTESLGGGLTKMIGTGPWIFKEWVSGSHVKLDANTNFYFTADDFDTLMINSFWKSKGDATALNATAYDIGRISGYDVTEVTKNWGTNAIWCDFDKSGKVDDIDLDLVNTNYGKVAG
jgi:peptide/nickel transport system substrate-binding protein